MSRVSMMLPLAAMLMALAGTARAEDKPADKPKGEQVTLTGSLSCAFCKLAHPDKPCASKDCCVNCIKTGTPAVLADAQGNLYLLVSGEHEKVLMTEERLKLVGSDVTVKGLLVKAKGIQMIFVDSMEKAEKPDK